MKDCCEVMTTVAVEQRRVLQIVLWITRNDVMANAGVLLAAAGVFVTGSAWPDVAMGLMIAAMFATSALGVIREARRALRPRRSAGSPEPFMNGLDRDRTGGVVGGSRASGAAWAPRVRCAARRGRVRRVGDGAGCAGDGSTRRFDRKLEAQELAALGFELDELSQ